MSAQDLWIIECRKPDGTLDFSGPQPEDIFGDGAIRGLSEHHMGRVVFSKVPDAVLTGEGIATWPALIDSRWRARRWTW